MKSITHYSEEWPGSESNYKWTVKFDKTDGIVGITQWHNEHSIERVLLNKRQALELVKFIKGEK